jgi:hypothetical protein
LPFFFFFSQLFCSSRACDGELRRALSHNPPPLHRLS